MVKKRNTAPVGTGLDLQEPVVFTNGGTAEVILRGASESKAAPSTPPAEAPEDSDGPHQTLSDSSPPADATDTTNASVKSVDPVVKEHGALFVAGEKTIHGNQPAITAKFACDHRIRFASENGAFTAYSAIAGGWETVREPDVKGRLVEGAIKHLQELNQTGDFQLSAAQAARVDDLLHESRSPEIFVAGRVIKKKDADLTVDELTHGYLDFCRAKGWEPFRTRQFENELFDLMEKFHGLRRRNDLTRGTKWHRGFKHVTLNAEDAK